MVKVGDVVRALDFPGNDTCFMQGEVVAVVDDLVYLTLQRVVFDGRDQVVEAGRTFTTPQLGAYMMDEMYPNRLEVVA